MVHRERFVGVRNLLHVRPDPDWVLGDAVSTSLGLLDAPTSRSTSSRRSPGTSSTCPYYVNATPS